MSTKYPGGIITKNYVAPTTTSASGIWTLEQQEQAQQAGIWPFGGPFNYIEDVFSTWLYTGNSATQTITNGIDLAGKGGLVWCKSRTNPATGTYHFLYDSVRGTSSGYYNSLATNTNDSNNIGGAYPGSYYGGVNSFNSDGFTMATPGNGYYWPNNTSGTYASWTFRKQPKFFDVVTYTATGASPQNVAHNLGSVPGFIIQKRTDAAEDWYCAALRSNGNYDILSLNTTAAANPANRTVAQVGLTSTTFDASGIISPTAGATYVAYLFASNAGGFGLTGTDNVISCGSYTGTGTAPNSISLGYEPQWLLLKNTTSADNWVMVDNMRGFPVGVNDAILRANLSDAEVSSVDIGYPTATGFNIVSTDFNTSASTYIYIAIRRGPMKVPTVGTSVYNAIVRTGTSANATVTGVGFTPDLLAFKSTDNVVANAWEDRLRGASAYLYTNQNAAEGISAVTVTSFNMDGFSLGTDTATSAFNKSPRTYLTNCFKRAPSFLDEICYDGTSATQVVSHNLTVPPELIITKCRSAAAQWYVVSSSLNAFSDYMLLSLDNASATSSAYLSTATNITVPPVSLANTSGNTYVAYLFASCPNVSKVGSYTGNGTTQTINCGFTGGVRFVLIKRTDSTGDWYIYDTTRGMTVLTDPYLLLNSASAQVATLGSVTTVTTGFALNSTILAAINVSGGTYLYLAIA